MFNVITRFLSTVHFTFSVSKNTINRIDSHWSWRYMKYRVHLNWPLLFTIFYNEHCQTEGSHKLWKSNRTRLLPGDPSYGSSLSDVFHINRQYFACNTSYYIHLHTHNIPHSHLNTRFRLYVMTAQLDSIMRFYWHDIRID